MEEQRRRKTVMSGAAFTSLTSPLAFLGLSSIVGCVGIPSATGVAGQMLDGQRLDEESTIFVQPQDAAETGYPERNFLVSRKLFNL
jgi:hypothetical protein